MQGRSWMAASTLAVTTVLASTFATRAAEKPVTHQVQLKLHIAGLEQGGSGCEVEIKPAHSGCKFRPVVLHVNPDGKGDVVLRDVQTSSADKECAFAITMQEPGNRLCTVFKGLRLRSADTPTSSILNCYLNSPTKTALAREEQERRRR